MKGKEYMRKKVNLKGLLVVGLISYACYILGNQQITINRLNREIAATKQELSKSKETKQTLQDKVDMNKTDMHSEKEARENNFIKEGEIPVVSSK